MNPKKERYLDYVESADARELAIRVVDAAELARHLLGTLAEARFTDPVAHKIAMSAYEILSAAVGDALVSMRIAAFLSDARSPDDPV